MGYWDSLVNLVLPNRKPSAQPPLPEGVPAAVWPAWEQLTPQYPQPQPYNLANEGFRKNEIIYALIRKRMAAISTAPVRVYKEGKVDAEQAKHPLRALMRRPNPYLTEKQFWQYEACYKDIAGFSAWEIEFNNLGEPMALWPMMPHWCSFLRGDRVPLRAIRYQPYGLPPVDIPRENLLFFQDIDPLFPFIKGLSRSAVALRIATSDNKTTDFLTVFMQRGAVAAGVLKTQQSLQDPEADRLAKRWKEKHGGVDKWTEIAVLGSGADFTPTQMNFKDMDFSTIDGRAEGRMCAVFEVPPILLNSATALGAATYHNYQESKTAWYHGSISDEWEYLGSEVGEQLLPYFGDDADMVTRFDVSRVRAMQEDRDAKWKRADMAFQGGTLTRDEAREEMEYDPIDNEPIFNSGAPKLPGDEPDEPAAPIGLPAMPFGQQAPPPAFGQPPAPEANGPAEELKRVERRQFRAFASKRAKEGHPELAGEFKFKYLGDGEQRALLGSVAMLSLSAEIREATAALRETA